jgi:hypothetical protein
MSKKDRDVDLEYKEQKKFPPKSIRLNSTKRVRTMLGKHTS